MRIKIGKVAVDSGQIMITDPCYLRNWEGNDYNIPNIIKVDGFVFEEGKNWDGMWSTPLTDIGKTLNEITSEGKANVQRVGPKETGKFSYDGACRATLGENGYGQLYNGCVMVSRTAYGDGTYPVYADIDTNGTIMSLTINFDDESEDEDDINERDEYIDYKYHEAKDKENNI